MMQVDDHLAAAVTAQILCDVADQWATPERNRGLGAINGQRPQPCAVTGSENHRAHDISFGLRKLSGSGSSMRDELFGILSLAEPLPIIYQKSIVKRYLEG